MHVMVTAAERRDARDDVPRDDVPRDDADDELVAARYRSIAVKRGWSKRSARNATTYAFAIRSASRSPT